MRVDQPREVVAKVRTFAPPATDADVRVVSLREHPAVAAGDDPELDDRGSLEPGAVDRAVRDVRLQRDAPHDPVPEAGLARDDPVRAVGADEHVRDDLPAVDARRHAIALVEQVRHAHAVSEVGPGRGRLLREMQVEPAPLRHEDERRLMPPREAPPVAKPDAEPVDDVLDDRVDRAGRMPERASGEPAAARLVPREARAIDEEHLRPALREPERGRRAGRPCPDDESVEVLHRRIVDRRSAATIARRAGIPEWPKGAGCKPAGSAFGGSNPPPCTPACWDTVRSAPS